jgi:hypothetical protein
VPASWSLAAVVGGAGVDAGVDAHEGDAGGVVAGQDGCFDGEAPRYWGSSEAWMLMRPLGNSSRMEAWDDLAVGHHDAGGRLRGRVGRGARSGAGGLEHGDAGGQG